MDTFFLLVMAAAGLCAGDQYYFVYDLKTMTEAQQHCKEKNATLATIHNMEDVTTLNKMADLGQMVSSSGQAWIGLQVDPNDWKWSLLNTSFYEHLETEFSAWKSGQSTKHSCTAMASNGEWQEVSCESAYRAACMDVRGTNATFVHTDRAMTWPEAQSYCREHHTDMASVRNQAENLQIKYMLTTHSLWMGLFRDSWNWSDGSSSSFRYWDLWQPSSLSNSCVAANFGKSGKWAIHDCSLRKPFICHDPRQDDPRLYYFVYDLKTMTEAQSYCRENNTELATIRNMEDVTTLNHMADLGQMINSSGQAWIGLYGEPGSWRWSLSNDSDYKSMGTDYRAWPSGYPKGNHCAAMFHLGIWYDNSCGFKFHAVCMDVSGTNVTFVRTRGTMTWPEAQSYCREHHTDLAIVRNQAEDLQIKNMIVLDYIFIGLSRNSWTWSDGSSSSFRYWGSGKPSGLSVDCAAADFSNSGKWANHDCSLRKPFICYGPFTTKKVIKLRLLKKDPLDLNDPAVAEGVLKQVRLRLKDQGLDDNHIKLSWKKQADGKVLHQEKKRTKKKACPGKGEL